MSKSINLKFGIIILNWNNYEETKKCINSILLSIDNQIFDSKIYLIDNNSQDGSGIRLKNEFSKSVKFYNTNENKGYTGGNNFGILKAIKDKSDYILILNNDLEIANFDLMLKSMNEVFLFNSEIGVVGFRVFDKETKKPLKSAGKINEIFTKMLKIDTTPINLSKNLKISYQKAVCGCAIGFKVKCLNEIGLFDEDFFMYAEEQDICLRAIKNNWRVAKIENKNLKIYRSIDPISENQLTWYYNTRNIFCAYRKNIPFLKRNIFSILQFLIFLKEMIYYLIKLKPLISYKILLGLKDALIGTSCHKDKTKNLKK